MLSWMLVAALLGADPTAEQASLLKTFRDEFVVITPGMESYPAQFTMGSDSGPMNERPAHPVAVKKRFSIARYEVPQNLWQAVTGNNPSRWKGPRNSAELFNYDEAVDFCRKTTELMRAAKLIDADEVIRLPTEAEWEYCARASSTSRYSFGDDPAELGKYGWFNGNAAGNDPPVGAKLPNAWKLYDMHGYLWEWCSDAWHDNYEGAPTDGRSWDEGGDASRRVLRSGSWKDKAPSLASSFRRAESRTTRDDAIGLRCVLSKAEVK